MKTIRRTLTISTLILTLSGGLAFAQDHHDDQRNQDRHSTRSEKDHGRAQSDRGRHDNHRYVHHRDWKRGHRLSRQDWQRGDRVDWRAHRLRQPPRGYEWREIDGNYVLAAVATGIIASIIIAAASH